MSSKIIEPIKSNLMLAKWVTESSANARKTTRALMQILEQFEKSGLDRARIDVTFPDAERLECMVRARDVILLDFAEALVEVRSELTTKTPDTGWCIERITSALLNKQAVAWRQGVLDNVQQKTETGVEDENEESKPVAGLDDSGN